MWPQWFKSPGSRSRKTSTTISPRFTSLSLKDVQSIINEPRVNEFGQELNFPKTLTISRKVQITASFFRTWSDKPNQSKLSPMSINPVDRTIVFYFTSLCIIRKTYEDCKTVRSILHGYCVPIDERDLSLEERFIDELEGIMGSKKVSLPVVFIGGKYVGGAERIKELNESGELKNLIGGLPFVNDGVCEMCGRLGFIVCEECNGSHKIYNEKNGFKSCIACNVNGLVRCPSCCAMLWRSVSAS